MRLNTSSPSVPVRLASLAILIATAGLAQDSAKTSTTGVNLAPVAVASSSYVSSDTAITALNDDYTPRNSRDNRRGSYGNWPHTGTEWVEYDWSRPISTKQVDVYWWMDGRGIGAPKSCRLLYWDGNGFAPVRNPSGLGVEGNRFNTTTFDEVRTSKLRLEIESDGTLSTGILEWRVYDSGASPEFPPVVTAGLDRDVVTGGRTYLAGKVRSLKSGDVSVKVAWSEASGPGKVAFENAAALETTATFSAPGEYVLQLTAGDKPLSSSSTLKVRVQSPPPADRLDVVYTKNYRIDSPLWNARAKALIVNWIPHCIDLINSTNLRQGQGGIDNFIEAAKALRGEPHSPHKGFVFANAWVHQTVESMCIALMVDPKGDPEIIRAQEKMKAALEDWIPKILAAQEPDGYLQTAFTLRNANGPWRERWSAAGRGNHEGYVSGYFIESAINHYTMTDGKDKRLYNAAKKLADCWADRIGPGKQEWYDGHQEMEQALVRFGRFVNDMEGPGHGDRYIQLAKFLLDCRKNGSEYDQSHLPVTRQYEAVGHAVRATYTYSGMADVAAETHDPDYQSAVMSLWDSMVNHKYYLTGGIGSESSNEGFGPDYSLRNNGYCESCSTCGLIFFQYKMNLAYHDAKYADLFEESLYNALLGSIDIDGRNFYYDNLLNGGPYRYSWHNCPCCVGNIPRTLLMIPTWTYAKEPDAIYVNLFIGSTINVEKIAGTDVQMVQQTDYPWSGKVAITVNPKASKRFSVHVRVPNRATSELYTATPAVNGLKSLAVNGKSMQPKIEKGYAVITRDWNAGDKIELELPLAVQTVRADSRIAADRGRLALRYGPLVYNVERADQQDPEALIDAKGPFTTEWKPDLLQGVMVINGRFADGQPLTAIPNYARNNRGDAPPAEAGGDSSIDYSGAAGGAPNAAVGGNRPNRSRQAASNVWLKSE